MTLRPSLLTFLRESKRNFLEAVSQGNTTGHVLVTGNESGDLDSAASAIAFAYLSSLQSSQQYTPHKYAALYRQQRADIRLRQENVLAFEDCGLAKEDLLCLDDLPEDISKLNLDYALIDHNRLAPVFGSRETSVVSIVDHHIDEGFHQAASPRLIQTPVGSCSSLVVKHFSKTTSPDQLPTELANLLLSALLIDTDNMKTSAGKAVDVDFESLSFLSQALGQTINVGSVEDSRSAYSEKHARLKEAKYAIGHLSARDLLRRDYKEYQSEKGWRYGLSTVPMSLEAWSERDSWEVIIKAAQEWGVERSLDAVGVLTTFRRITKKGNDKGRREVLLYISSKDLAGLPNAFEQAGRQDLALEKWKGEQTLPDFEAMGANVRVWTQGNAEATRKKSAPAFAEALSYLPGKLNGSL